VVSLVNREAEKSIVVDAIHTLRNYQQDILRTPIIDLYGIVGIGKTAILQHVEDLCKQYNIAFISVDASHGADFFSREIIAQAQQFNVFPPVHDDLSVQSKGALVRLLEQDTAVLLLDNVDTTNEALTERISYMLNDIINDNKMLVILASHRGLFDFERSIARKLTSLQLKPLNYVDCETYFDIVSTSLDRNIRDCIFEWTRGYPLAMEVMIKTITERGLDPRKPADQQPLLESIIERVIDQGILAHSNEPERQRYKEALNLLSIPRRFNLVIMQDLIEKFAPNLKRESSLSYMRLPRMINQDIGVLSWDMFKAGFTVESPIRNIFLLKNRIEQHDQYLEKHRFLAKLNKKFADEVSGSDYLRYLREFLYHSAHVLDSQQLSLLVTQTVSFITNGPYSLFEQFREEFLQDHEFQEVLGDASMLTQSLLYQRLAREHKKAALLSSSENERLDHLAEYFACIVHDPLVSDIVAVLTQHIGDILADMPPGTASSLLADLLQTEKLGRHFELVVTLLQKVSAEESGQV
jgi:hypothetical protein